MDLLTFVHGISVLVDDYTKILWFVHGIGLLVDRKEI